MRTNSHRIPVDIQSIPWCMHTLPIDTNIKMEDLKNKHIDLYVDIYLVHANMFIKNIKVFFTN